MITTRLAIPDDAPALSTLLGTILRGWNSDRPSDPDYVRTYYISHPEEVACTVALSGETIVGFQSLRRAVAGNTYGVTPGWGIIGSYVDAAHAGRGVGRALFTASHAAARAAGLPAIDATISEGNAGALAYYSAMGFRDYNTRPGAICKRFVLDPT